MLLLYVAWAGGCAIVGPSTIERGRLYYNEAVQVTSDQELLLNIVRLRYRDNPAFLQVSNITTQYNLGGGGRASTSIVPSSAESFGLSGDISYFERPTISYRPIVGEAYIKQMLEPIDEEKLTLLYNAGWPIDTLFSLTVQSINGVQNAPGISGPAPALNPEFLRFQRVIHALGDLQRAGRLTVGRDDNQAQLRIEPGPAVAEQVDLIQSSLSLDTENPTYNLAQAADSENDNAIAIVPRSLVSAMFYLSQGVDIPPADLEAGRAFTAEYSNGEKIDWQTATRGLFRIHTARIAPSNAYTSVKYRGRWFYIDDSDLSSKTTFALVGQLFAIQAGNVRTSGPLLTLPVGG